MTIFGVDGMEIRKLPTAFFNNIVDMSQQDVAYVVLSTLLGHEFSSEMLRNLVQEWLEWECKLKPVGEGIYAYEPLQGPTLSQYDLMARLAALLVKYRQQGDSPKNVNRVFCCSHRDSAAATGRAFLSVMGQCPVIFQSVGSLNELEKRQLFNIVPADDLCVVRCDDAMLARLCDNCAATLSGSHEDVTWISCGCEAFVIAGVFMYFDAYRLLKHVNEEVSVMRVACNVEDIDKASQTAAHIAEAMGLPVQYVKMSDCGDTVDDIIVEAYRSTGYILCPSSAQAWKSLKGNGDGVCGVFVQECHPAKFRARLEPLLNRVILLPHRLQFGEHFHPRYKYLAPTVNAIKATILNSIFSKHEKIEG